MYLVIFWHINKNAKKIDTFTVNIIENNLRFVVILLYKNFTKYTQH